MKDVTEKIKQHRVSVKSLIDQAANENQIQSARQTLHEVDNVLSNIVEGAKIIVKRKDDLLVPKQNVINMSNSMTNILNVVYQIKANEISQLRMQQAKNLSERRKITEFELENQGHLPEDVQPSVAEVPHQDPFVLQLREVLPLLTQKVEEFTKALDNYRGGTGDLLDSYLPDILESGAKKGGILRPIIGGVRTVGRFATSPVGLVAGGIGLMTYLEAKNPGTIRQALYNNSTILGPAAGMAYDAGKYLYKEGSKAAEQIYYTMSGNIRENFKNVMMMAAKAGDPHPEITAAQWALESGYGKHMSGKNNPFGQKARDGEPGTVKRTREVIGGKDRYIDAKFKDYDSLDQAIAEHVSRWTSKKTKKGSTPLEAAQAIQGAGYATDPNYANALSSILAANNIDPSQPFTNVNDAIKTASNRSLGGKIVLGVSAAVTSAQMAFARDNHKMINPLSSTRVSSPFGWRSDPVTGQRKQHKGVDFPAPIGTGIRATQDGKIEYAGPASGYGNLIKILHDGGIETLYGHMNNVLVKTGDVVKGGQIIGTVGNKGHSTGPHLHYEVHVQGQPVDPMGILTGNKALEQNQTKAAASTEPGMELQPNTNKKIPLLQQYSIEANAKRAAAQTRPMNVIVNAQHKQSAPNVNGRKKSAAGPSKPSPAAQYQSMLR